MPRRRASAPARSFVFTLYAPEELSDAAQQEYLTGRATTWTRDLPEDVRFLVLQLERGNTGNRLHLQGYLQCRSPQRFSRLHRLLDPRLALDESHGSADANLAYCTKEDTRVDGPWQAGTMVGQGKRSDLDALKESIYAGKSDAYLWENHFSCMAKYRNVATTCRAVRIRAATAGTPAGSEPPLKPLSVYVYWGLPGSGKTRRAIYESDYGVLCSATKDRIWFDNYEPGRDIILDEFDGEIPINELKRLLDVYPVELPVKGSHVPRDCKRIFVTSNIDPINWYPTVDRVHRDALFRRFTAVEHVSAAWYPPVAAAPPANLDPASPDAADSQPPLATDTQPGSGPPSPLPADDGPGSPLF